MKAESTQQDISVKDERLDIDHIDHYLLSFFIGSHSCELAIYDERKKRVLMLESIKMDDQKSILDNLKEIHYEHILISAGFWKRIEVTLRNHRFCQVPNSMYSGEHAYDYIKLSAPTEPLNEKYLSIMDEKQQCTTVFSVPNELMRWFDGKYPKPSINYKHESVNLLEAIQPLVQPESESQLFINLTLSDLQLAGYSKGKLSIYNQFQLKSPQHAAKIVLMSIKQFSEEGQSIPILLWGTRSVVETYYPGLKKFYKNLQLGQRPRQLKMSNAFDVVQEHEFFDILGSY